MSCFHDRYSRSNFKKSDRILLDKFTIVRITKHETARAHHASFNRVFFVIQSRFFCQQERKRNESTIQLYYRYRATNNSPHTLPKHSAIRIFHFKYTMIAKFTSNAKHTMKQKVPAEYICPLTKGIMVDPLINRHGVTYERTAIIDHITRQSKPYCPKTKKPMSVRDLVPNYRLRMEIMHYRQDVLGEDTTSGTTSGAYHDEDAIREAEFIRAMTQEFSPPKRSKKALATSRRLDLTNMMKRFCPASGSATKV